jgi:hypothetical protein
MELAKREPALIIGVVQAVLQTLIALLVAFGLSLNAQQTGAILAFTSAVATLIATLITRSQVTPVADPRNRAGQRLRPA